MSETLQTGTPKPVGTLRQLRELPHDARWMVVGIGLFALGTGLTLPFLLVYLHDVRGISTLTVGLIFGWTALLSLAAAPIWGSLIDRIGPRPVLLMSLGLEAAAVLLLAIVSTTWHAFAVASLLAVGSAGGWPSQASIIARLVPAQQRQWLFGVQFMLLNLGIGVGGLVSATFVDTSRPGTFQALYVLDAISYLVYAAVIMWLPSTLGREPSPDDEATAIGHSTSGGYREVLADRVFLRLFIVAAVLVLFGYAQIEVGFTAYATQVVDAPARWLGIAFAANTATIVLGQLFILSRLEGRSRSRALALVGAIWGMSWLVIAAAGFAPSTFLIVAGLALGASCFAVGEIIWSPVFPALVNDLAPEHLRGRYNAVASAAWNVGNLLGPVYAGVLIGADLGGLWVGVTVLGCVGGAAGAFRLRAHLETQQDGRPAGSGDTMAT